MTKNTKLINVNRKAWESIRLEFPSMSDTKRSIIAARAIKELGLSQKLRPELNDSRSDKFLKNILKDLL